MGSDMAWRRLVLHQYWRPGNPRPSRRNANGSQLMKTAAAEVKWPSWIAGTQYACKGSPRIPRNPPSLAGPPNIDWCAAEAIQEPR